MEKEMVDRRKGGKTILKSEQEWTNMPDRLRQLKTGHGGKGSLRSHLWCSNDLQRL